MMQNNIIREGSTVSFNNVASFSSTNLIKSEFSAGTAVRIDDDFVYALIPDPKDGSPAVRLELDDGQEGMISFIKLPLNAVTKLDWNEPSLRELERARIALDAFMALSP